MRKIITWLIAIGMLFSMQVLSIASYGNEAIEYRDQHQGVQQRINDYYSTEISIYSGDIGKIYGEFSNLDLDLDGKRDAVIRSFDGREGHYSMKFGNGEVLEIYITDDTVGTVAMFSFQDINGDGIKEILAVQYASNSRGYFVTWANVYMKTNGSWRAFIPAFDEFFYTVDFEAGTLTVFCDEYGFSETVKFEGAGIVRKQSYNSGVCGPAKAVDVRLADEGIAVLFDMADYETGEYYYQPIGEIIPFNDEYIVMGKAVATTLWPDDWEKWCGRQ